MEKELSDKLILSMGSVSYWHTQAARRVPEGSSPEVYRENFKAWDNALVSAKALKRQAHILAEEELGGTIGIREAALGFEAPTDYIVPARLLSAYEEVLKAYQESLPQVGEGGLVECLMLDVTRVALESWMESL